MGNENRLMLKSKCYSQLGNTTQPNMNKEQNLTVNHINSMLSNQNDEHLAYLKDANSRSKKKGHKTMRSPKEPSSKKHPYKLNAIYKQL